MVIPIYRSRKYHFAGFFSIHVIDVVRGNSMIRFSCWKIFGALCLFCIATAIAHGQTYSVLHNFGSRAGDPVIPYYSGIIAQGRDGNLYGSTCQNNGAFPLSTPADFYGTAYKMNASGNISTFDFNVEAECAYGGLTLGTDGNFYGTTYWSVGPSGQSEYATGTIFKMTARGIVTVLHQFTGGSDGATPYAPPVEGRDGNFYGTTAQDSTAVGGGFGTIYKITPSGQFTTLHVFSGSDGGGPFAPLVLGIDGNFYGTTWNGGLGYGVVFKIQPSGKFTLLHQFNNSDGGDPSAPLILGSDGNFYGTTTRATAGSGTIFKMKPSGQLTVLHYMDASKEGEYLLGGLVEATDGNFYGSTGLTLPSGYGTIFRITPAGELSVLHNFSGANGYAGANATILQHTNGLLYGTTETGGTGEVNCTLGQCGVFYSLDIGAAPFVTTLPAAAPVGKTVEILGQGFTGTALVSFNGTATNFTVVTDKYMTAVVPAGATTGKIVVTEPGGTVTSSKTFRVLPQIFNFSPTSGAAGTTVVITGDSFIGATFMTFGGRKPASFTVNSDTQITAIVPASAMTGPINLVTPGGHCGSATSFTVTP
jgi:uncharacterized repeat protein (TIGR03803 family)